MTAPAKIGHNNPPKPAKTYPALVCPECGERFTPTHHRAVFCSPAHAKAHNNRALAEGQRIVGLAKAWRAGRSTSDPKLKAAAKEAFGQLCRELDLLSSVDKAAGRMHPTELFRRRSIWGLLDR